MHLNRHDAAAGAFFAAVGLSYGLWVWSSLPMGRALNMGPGYFPIVLCAVLIGLGIAIFVRGLCRPQVQPIGVVPWRPIIMLSLATIIFAAFLDDLGMFPGLLVTTFLATQAKASAGKVRGAVISVGVAAFCTLVFIYAIGLSVPVLGTWFSGGTQ